MDNRAPGSGLPRQELTMLQQVMQIISMDLGRGGSTARLEKAKDIRRKTLEWAEEGDSKRRREERARKAESRKRAQEDKERKTERLEHERDRQHRRYQERVQRKTEERLEPRRLEESTATIWRKRLDKNPFDEEQSEEEEGTASEEGRRKVQRWIEEQSSLQKFSVFAKNLRREENNEASRQSGKKKSQAEIEDNEERMLNECRL